MTIISSAQALHQKLKLLSTGEEKIAVAADELSRAFGVRSDEVALLYFDPDLQVLRFLWPQNLRSSGFIPLNSPDALASRTLREKKGLLNNRFANMRHASIFEHVRRDAKNRENPVIIQKIISAPIVTKERQIGVVQISRKGTELNESGPDFTREDLALLVELSRALALHLADPLK